ncbi:xanthine dehydrogenase family protein molybdopterin-binding subunit [Plantactinospora sp. B24E8]|uniref:xanthine dehydrogenase family protein molybdopterin-binding subunit n=1 Tax=Plantactinospora sp. B24E8 TaxID=3153567 RepID=UPI00325DDF8B
MNTGTVGIGRGHPRLEGPAKVTGTARYAAEYPADGVAYAWAVQSSVAKGRIVRIDPTATLAEPGVLDVLTYENAPRLHSTESAELFLLQTPQVHYRGEFVALVLAESLEAAREGALLLRVDYDTEPHSSLLTEHHPGLYRPEKVNPSYPTDTALGDFEAGYAAAEVQLDQTYRTPAYHNNPMEPHSATARWLDGRLLVHDSSQGSTLVRDTLGRLFNLPAETVRVISAHVGGGFGSKGSPRCTPVLAAMAARHLGRPVRLALTRQQVFGPIGYRTPTIQRLRLGSDADGRLAAICHDAISQTSTGVEFAEQTAVLTRSLYAAPHRRTTHRLTRLDVPTPSWMRAPGECPGSFALECAMDELAVACGMDPVELRIRNDTDVDPEEGLPFTSRNLVACLREGARRFGWADRDPTPGVRRHGRCLVGTGVASAIYPARTAGAHARARVEPDGSYQVSINATDIGTGARTALWLVAAEALAVPGDRVTVEVGDSDLPPAFVAGGSFGTAGWGWAVDKACRELRRQLAERHGGTVPAAGLTVQVDTMTDVAEQPRYARYAFGAHFVEVRVDVDSGEIRVPRMLGIFATGRVVNPATARSQLIGGMTMGLSMALHEEGALDHRFGDWVNRDLATYHIASCADVEQIDADWVDDPDERVNPLGIKGLGEIGIVGSAAAVANAVYHATGIRVRELPIQPDKLLDRLPTT